MKKEVVIEEEKLPTPKSIAWTMKVRDNEDGTCTIFILGGKGSKKAVFTVDLFYFINEVNKLGDTTTASHPARHRAIQILEAIADRLGKPNIFDCTAKDDTRWYDFEDMITDIIAGEECED